MIFCFSKSSIQLYWSVIYWFFLALEKKRFVFFFGDTGIYLTITMGMTSLSIILTVFVLQLYHVTPRQRPVPPWLRHFMFECVANALRMRTDVDGYRSCALADVFNANDTCKVVDSPARQPTQQATPNDRKCFIETVSYRQMAPPGELSANGIVCQPSSASRNASGDRRGRCGLPTDAGCVDGVRTASNRDRGKTADGVRPMTATGLVEIALVTSRPTTTGDADDNRGIVMTEEELRRHIGNEWKLVALIMDRLLFLLFLIISTLSTFGILVVHPLTKPSIVEWRIVSPWLRLRQSCFDVLTVHVTRFVHMVFRLS